jgi:hypothetical protein
MMAATYRCAKIASNLRTSSTGPACFNDPTNKIGQQMHSKQISGFIAALALLGACGKKEDTAATQQAPAAAQQAAPAAQSAPFDPDKYGVTAAELTSTFGEQDWNKYHQTAADLVLHSNATTPDVLAALKFPAYASITNPFDKENFKKEHQADLAVADAGEEKIKLIVLASASATLEPGDPLHGIYKGNLTMNSGSSFGYGFGNNYIKYVLKHASDNMNFISFNRNVPEAQAKAIESNIKRSNNGVATSVPLVIYGTVVGTNVTYAGTSQTIEVDVKPDVVALADKVGYDAKPLLQVFPSDSNSQ